MENFLYATDADIQHTASPEPSFPQVENVQEEEIANITVIEDPSNLGEEDTRPEEERRKTKKANLNSTPEVMEEGNTSGITNLLLYRDAVKFGEMAEIVETESEEEEDSG